MILVDIKVPSLDTSYDFQLDEESTIYNLIVEIAELISQKEHCNIVGKVDKLMLCTTNPTRILNINKNLREYGVQTGASLLLV